MARIRSVSPGLRSSDTVADWPIPARYAWVLLWGYLDDYGRGLDNAKVIAADCFPLDDEVNGMVMGEWLDLYEKAESICRYEYEHKRYLHILNWSDHQKPQHPSKMRVPPCREHEAGALAAFEAERDAAHRKVSGNPHEGLVTVSPTSRGGGGVELEMRGRPPAAKPQKAPRCSRHSSPSLKDPPPCGECKEIRLAFEAKDNLERPALSMVPGTLACPDHPGQFKGACSGCAANRKAVG